LGARRFFRLIFHSKYFLLVFGVSGRFNLARLLHVDTKRRYRIILQHDIGMMLRLCMQLK